MTNALIMIGVMGIVIYGFFMMKKLDRFLQTGGILPGEREDLPELHSEKKKVRRYHAYPGRLLSKKIQPLS